MRTEHVRTVEDLAVMLSGKECQRLGGVLHLARLEYQSLFFGFGVFIQIE